MISRVSRPSVVTLPLTLLKDVTLETRHDARWSRFSGINAEKFTERSRRGEKRESISSSFYLSPFLSLAIRDRAVKRENRPGKEGRGSGRGSSERDRRAVFTTTRKKNLFAMVV